MAGEWFAGLGQTIAGGIATGVTFGQVEAVNNWTVEGAKKVHDNSEKAWGEDGDVTQFFEAVPGYVAAAGHAMAGDEQRARRAAARGTKAALVTAGTVGGFFVGGPPGAIAGGAAASAAGQCAEFGINHAIDEEHRTDAGTYDEFDGRKFAAEIALDGALCGIGAGVGSTVGKSASRAVVGPTLKEAGKVIVKNPARCAVKTVVKQAVSKGATAISKPVLKKAIN